MIPSRVLNSGITNPLLALNICGDGVPALTATGTDLATAFPIASVWNQFGTVALSTGAALPTTENGIFLAIANDGLQTLTVYAPTGSTVDGSASVTIAAGKRRIFWTVSTTIWLSLLGA